jgi:hypothetical protein
MKRNPLLDELREAFPPVPIVTGDYSKRGSCYSEEYRRRLDGATWDQLDPQFFARRVDSLSFLGMPYIIEVLPCYLHLLIVFKPTSPVPETLIPLLTKPDRTDRDVFKLFDTLTRRFGELTRALTEGQSRIVGLTLQEFVKTAPWEGGPAQLALDRYWHDFVPEERRAVPESGEKTCEECQSRYFAASSKVPDRCPECAHVLFYYPSCEHVFETPGQPCTRCGWDGSRSPYVRRVLEGRAADAARETAAASGTDLT